MPYMRYLSRRGYLSKPDLKILDIGSQCLLGATPEEICDFVEKHGRAEDAKKLRQEIERIAYFSTPRPGERTSYISELLDLTDFEYTSYDVCPALKTEIFDLNKQALPEHYREHFDLAFNFGTTEHILNQLNCFRVIHEALAAGGIAFHQLPTAGYVNHGYFCYHLSFFRDLANSNNYEILDHWYTPTGVSELRKDAVEIRDAVLPDQSHSGNPEPQYQQIPDYLINVVMRKRESRPFALPLELATAHASLSDGLTNNDAPPAADDLTKIPGRALARELKKRIIRRITGLGNR